jgi:hypothetical protein
MDPHPNITFGGGAADSTMTPIAFIAMALAAILLLTLPRKKAIVPFLLFMFLVPLGEQFNIAGIHLFAGRIVILCGCLRFLFRQPLRKALAGGFTSIDKIFLAWALCRATAFVLLYHAGGALLNQIGFLWDALGGYFLVRCLIRNVEDIRRVAKLFVAIAVVNAGCMIYEHYKLTNVFGLLMGGRIVPDIRLGKVRCRGVFQMEIISSTFGGTLVPMFICLWAAWKERVAAVVGLIAAAIITITASSSTGIGAAAVAVAALCLWPLRKYTRQMRWAAVAVILALAVVMKAPVWFLLARVDFVGGSTGWDRANLIDQCIRHIGNWWLVGTADNDKWGFFTWDLCNQFVAEAVQGGLITLLLYFTLIKRSFGRIGLARKVARNRTHELLLWIIGCILCAHIAGFFGISYFDQMKYWWFATLAMIPAAVAAVRAESAERVLVPSPVSVEHFSQSTGAAAYL